LLVAGHTVSLAGSMITSVALPFQIYAVTGSSLAVGLLGAAELVRILALGVVGGALADAFDRRRLVALSEAGSALVAAGLVVNAVVPQPRVWPLYACGALMAGFTAVRRPPLDALVPRLVERDELKAAAAIHVITRNLAFVGGPAIGGILIAAAGLGATYAVDLASFAASLAALAAMRTPPGPALGDVEAGAVAALAGVRAAVISGGVLCVAGTAVLAVALPRFWRYDARAAAVAGPLDPRAPAPPTAPAPARAGD
jgi:Na+/melibiose symporter-like transporter